MLHESDQLLVTLGMDFLRFALFSDRLLEELPRDRDIYVICRAAQKAYYANRILLQYGYKAKTLSGGILMRTLSSWLLQ